MKKVINGSLYNTETAKLIGTWDNDLPTNDFRYFSETLYQTKSGKYFLYGEGHGNSKYGVWHGNTGGWGEKIRPFTPQDARLWSEEHLDADDYAAIFGEPEEASENKEVLNLTISAELKRRLILIREETGKSISKIIEEKFMK